MWLADTSIKRPVTATMFLMALVVLGIVSYPSIGVDLYPKVDFPIVNVTTRLIGASPEIMDIDVTDKIEESINTINGVKTISSQSVEGVSVVTVEFELEKNIDLAVQDVREKISIIRSKLPTDIEEPIIQKVDPDATPVLWLSLSGSRSIGELSTYADEVLQEKLQKVSGVGAVNVTGIRLRQVRIWLSRDKLQAYQITSSDVSQALARENVEIPGGRIESLSKEYSIKVKGEFPRVSDFNDLIVAYSKGAPVRIRNIGRAEDGLEERRSIARLNGETAVGLGIQKQSGTNTVEVVDLVKKELAKVQKTLPPGMNLCIKVEQHDAGWTSANTSWMTEDAPSAVRCRQAGSDTADPTVLALHARRPAIRVQSTTGALGEISGTTPDDSVPLNNYNLYNDFEVIYLASELGTSGSGGWWTHGGRDDDWEIAAPLVLSVDPALTPENGLTVAGTDLTVDGYYPSNQWAWLVSPAYTMPSQSLYDSVSVEYYRCVRLSATDDAYISIGFSNSTTPPDSVSSAWKLVRQYSGENQLDWDDEWIDLTPEFTAAWGAGYSYYFIRFLQYSGPFMERGGWNLDNIQFFAVPN